MAKKILLVDDEPTALELLKMRLESNNYAVALACNGEEALAKVKTDFPDLIILDIMMPGMGGWDVLKELKKDSMTEFIPVIMLTAKGESESIMKADQLKATDYIIKPFDAEQLLILVKKHIG